MPKYVDAEELIKGRVSNDPVVIAVKCAESVSAVPAKHAQWLKNSLSGKSFCSNCHYHPYLEGRTKYCPNCGALMDGKKEKTNE